MINNLRTLLFSTILGLAFCFNLQSHASVLTDLALLEKHLPEGYVSEESEIISLDGITSSESEYRAVIIRQVTGTGYRGTTRLAIFSKKGEYIGVYSGLIEEPISITAKGIHFPFEEDSGNAIYFDESGPRAVARLDGELFRLKKGK